MIWLDAFFRFASVGMILMTAVLAVRDLPKSTPSVLLLITMLCLLGLFLGHAPPVFEFDAGRFTLSLPVPNSPVS